ncbi:hypothetical protein BDY19DRAFT_900582 [Irpex rosettiformis]|uniref:Uncharacterized protein n=1 Tax=Irpex rosettiformis TaxID=378272 RepID=A0ACB8TMK9_9APHY|nr:hypothetical protein BDY19DRAFT_900582 [Irpex rosettiformis]
MLEDEDFARELQLHLVDMSRREGYIRAQDVVDYVAKPDVQERLVGVNGGRPVTISISTGRRWLKKLSWRYTRVRKGMYVDGHEREDVVEYRNAFVKRWKEYEKRMTTFDTEGNPVESTGGFPTQQRGRFKLILVTHDESTFYANDRRKTKWVHASEKAASQPKGEGSSIMVSDFLVPEWGRLKCEDEEARIFFKAGKNRNGYFTCEDLVNQVEQTIDVFDARTHGFATALFIFDNASSHQKRPIDGLSARYMPKGPHASWTPRNNGRRMRAGVNPLTGEQQEFYWPDNHSEIAKRGWFKGMEQIIRERGLWPEKGLRAECEGFKCVPGQTDCCC